MTEILAVKADFFKDLFHIMDARSFNFQQLQIFPLMTSDNTNERLFPITDGKYKTFNAGHLEKMKCINVNTRKQILQ